MAGGEENAWIAARLHEMAGLLHDQGANPFRSAAYERASQSVARREQPLRELFDAKGREGLQGIPGVGAGISSAIAELLVTGGWAQLARLRGAHAEAPEAPAEGAPEAPDAALLLQVDREYRQKAAAGKLPTIAPRRFNPEGSAWLPVLHATHGEWHFTALYSNTARAHAQGRTHDWVVIYFYDGDHRERQCTVVTETRGPLKGNRVVRGREDECRALQSGRELARSA